MAGTTPSAALVLGLAATKAVDADPAPGPPNATVRLTRGLAAGDEGAFREFHGLYFDRLRRFLLVVARGREEEAKEAVQQTFLRVARYAREFDSEETFWCWLKALARSAARDAGRKESRYVALLEHFARRFRAETGPAPADDTALGGLLEESLDELSPQDRRFIEGKYLEGRTVRELADESGLTHKAVESRLLRLRQQLRERALEKLRIS